MGGTDALSGADVERVRRTFARVRASAEDVALKFYAKLFAAAPELRPLFVRSTIDVQAQMFRETLYLVIDHLDDAPWLARTLQRLAERHVGYGVTPEMYEPVGRALLATIEDSIGDEWSPDVAVAWQRAFDVIRDSMLEGRT